MAGKNGIAGRHFDNQEGSNYGWPLIEGEETQEGLESPFQTVAGNLKAAMIN
ncbi:hypothetical protein B0H99_101167 [Planomicrobium soli]|uniref:Glucose/sorbosone dehydrogenase n=1 Tax=Planomicrobium soli TaxID=1176648 RepID=A0A2P8H6V1_9BACL|nr:hypothetical protein [Planomicrobium soli]PSL41921.1 hypothetical protein B0H99_101167 [Planomicrobium soli]